MAEYIEREALRRAMYHEAFETDTNMQRWDSGCWIRYTMFENAIEAAPAADVVPVVHGRWMSGREPVGPLSVVVPHCSACGAIVPVDVSRYKFCPNCGAKMDGGADHDD